MGLENSGGAFKKHKTGLAQLVERRPFKPNVAGSTPAIGISFYDSLKGNHKKLGLFSKIDRPNFYRYLIRRLTEIPD